MARCGQLEDEMEYATHGLLSFCHKFRQASVENEELNAIMSRVEITLRKLRAARADLLEERNILEARVWSWARPDHGFRPGLLLKGGGFQPAGWVCLPPPPPTGLPSFQRC